MVLNRLHTKRINKNRIIDQQHQREVINLTAQALGTYRKRPASYLCRWTGMPRAKAGGPFILVWESLSGIISVRTFLLKDGDWYILLLLYCTLYTARAVCVYIYIIVQCRSDTTVQNANPLSERAGPGGEGEGLEGGGVSKNKFPRCVS
jgi:hypothetical protein